MMPPTSPRVFGWSPPADEDFVQVSVNPHENPIFHISEDHSLRDFGSMSPASSTSTLSVDTDFHSDKHSGLASKHSDPSWVARPRNEFILFRCDYVKRNSREGKRIRRAPGAAAEKTLSKQAAEAWHELSPEERLYWKERADRERNEHARKYPDYRYRPKKSAIGKRHQTQSSSIEDSTSPPKPEGNALEGNVSPLDPCSPSLDRVATRQSTRGHRRSMSVSDLANIDISNRRLSSNSNVSQSWSVLPVTMPGLTFALTQTSYDQIPSPSHDPTYGSTDYPPLPQTREVISGPTSSSLLNWNGGSDALAAPQPTRFISAESLCPDFAPNDQSYHSRHTDCSEGRDGDIPEEPYFVIPSPYQTADDFWMPLQGYPGEGDIPVTEADNLIVQVTEGGEPLPAAIGYTIYDSDGCIHPVVNYPHHGWSHLSDLPGSSPETLFPEELFSAANPCGA